MIVALPSHNLSNAAASRSKHWIKKLTGVDTKIANGYAFEGDFVQFGGTVEVPEGTFFLSYIESRRGSGRLDGRTVTLWQASNGAIHVVKGWDLDGSAGWALHLRDEVATMFAAGNPAIADLNGYTAQWDHAASPAPDGEPEPHHGDQCAGGPQFVLGTDEKWSARCDRDTLCDGEGDNRMWEVTGCETLREAGARFFGGEDRRLYGVEE